MTIRTTITDALICNVKYAEMSYYVVHIKFIKNGDVFPHMSYLSYKDKKFNKISDRYENFFNIHNIKLIQLYTDVMTQVAESRLDN